MRAVRQSYEFLKVTDALQLQDWQSHSGCVCNVPANEDESVVPSPTSVCEPTIGESATHTRRMELSQDPHP